MPRPFIRYAILIALVGCAFWVRGNGAVSLARVLRNPAAYPSLPFTLQAATRNIGSGGLRLDQILAIDGRPFRSYFQFQDAVFDRHPGDTIRLTLSRPDGSAFEREVRIPSEAPNFDSASKIAVDIGVEIVIPLVSLFLGAFAVAVRPRDRNAWLLLFLMIGFSEIATADFGRDSGFSLVWNSVWGESWAVFMMLFGIYFPERAPFERRRPWIKYAIVAPLVILNAVYSGIVITWYFNLDAAAALRPLLMRIYFLEKIGAMIAVGTYFANVSMKIGMDPSPDSRRRLRILAWGSSISLAPVFLVALSAVIRGTDMFQGIPWAGVVIALLFLTLFPLTLAYVIVVERAMDLRFVIRQSVQYGLVKGGLWVARAGLIFLAVYLFSSAWKGHSGAVRPVELTGVGLALLVVRKRGATRASEWVDKRFFREAYNSERILGEFAKEVGRYAEIPPLLRNVATKIADTLHSPDIVILLRDGPVFVTRYSTRPGEPMNVFEDSRIVKALRERNEALEIYFDKPPLWLRSLTAEELQTLDFMRTQLLLPLTANERLTGMMSLGPKLSELPYTDTDIRLLQAIAWQMGLAIENSRLVSTLAAEAAAREIASRELEIAREVQERLFPQNYPVIAGLDCAGYCRPARGVGGDYYDFLQLDDGRLGIAVGDVSGKGIAAALLMASLQASLRGQAAANLHDLSSLMRNVNKLVYEASTSNRYATFFYGEFDPASKGLSFVNAGHNPPVILRGEETIRLEADGPVVGLLPGARYGQSECAMRPGDIFIAYTDGISEAQSESEEEWEEDRFIAAARQCAGLSAKDMIQSIFRAADAFTGSAKQYDDMTLLVIKLA